MLLALLVVYLLGVFWFASRGPRVDRLDNFLISRGSLSPYVLGVSYAASYASVSIFMGVSGWAYQYGEAVLFYQGAVAICTPLGLVIFALGFRKLADKYGPLSLADWIGQRYGSRFLRVGVGALTLCNIFYIAGQFIATALILGAFFGLPFVPAVILSVLVAVLFVIFGGMRVNVRSDFLQGLIMVTVALVIVIAGAMQFGGSPARLHNALAASGPEYTGLLGSTSPLFNSPWALASILWLLFIFPANPHLMNIVLALNSTKDFVKFVLTATACLSCFALAPLAGLYARGMGLQLEKADAALPEFLLAIFPQAIAFLLILAVLSAGLTTVSSLLVSVTGALSHDIRAILIRTSDASWSERKKLLWGRIGVGVLALAAAGIALTKPPSLTLLVWVGINGVLSGATGPLLGGIFFRNVHTKAAIASFITGLGSYLILYPTLMSNVLAAGALASFIGLATMLLGQLIAGSPNRKSDQNFTVDS